MWVEKNMQQTYQSNTVRDALIEMRKRPAGLKVVVKPYRFDEDSVALHEELATKVCREKKCGLETFFVQTVPEKTFQCVKCLESKGKGLDLGLGLAVLGLAGAVYLVTQRMR